MPANLVLGALEHVWKTLEPFQLPMAVMGGHRSGRLAARARYPGCRSPYHFEIDQSRHSLAWLGGRRD